MFWVREGVSLTGIVTSSGQPLAQALFSSALSDCNVCLLTFQSLISPNFRHTTMVSHRHPCLGSYSDSRATLWPSPTPLARPLKHPAQPTFLSPHGRAALSFPAWLVCVLTCVFPDPNPPTTPPHLLPLILQAQADIHETFP